MPSSHASVLKLSIVQIHVVIRIIWGRGVSGREGVGVLCVALMNSLALIFTADRSLLKKAEQWEQDSSIEHGINCNTAVGKRPRKKCVNHKCLAVSAQITPTLGLMWPCTLPGNFIINACIKRWRHYEGWWPMGKRCSYRCLIIFLTWDEFYLNGVLVIKHNYSIGSRSQHLGCIHWTRYHSCTPIKCIAIVNCCRCQYTNKSTTGCSNSAGGSGWVSAK